MTRKAPNKIFIVFNNSENKSLTGNAKTCLNWSQMDERRKQGIMKKWNLIGKNQYFQFFLMKTWNEEDPYGILFHIAVCPEEPCGIDFFRKEFGKSGFQKLPNIENPTFGQNRFKINVNRLNMGLKILPDRFWRVLNLFWHDFKGYYI